MNQRIFDTPEGKVLGTLIVTEEDMQMRREELLKPRPKLTTTQRLIKRNVDDFVTAMDVIEETFELVVDTTFRKFLFSFFTTAFALGLGIYIGGYTMDFLLMPAQIRYYSFIFTAFFLCTFVRLKYDKSSNRKK